MEYNIFSYFIQFDDNVLIIDQDFVRLNHIKVVFFQLL